jgi:hypothetical protein
MGNIADGGYEEEVMTDSRSTGLPETGTSQYIETGVVRVVPLDK